MNSVKVYIVGAGPGDPELLTIKAFKLIQSADVILYDDLVSEEILSLCEAKQMIYVGKRYGQVSCPQKEIHKLLEFYAESNNCIVRLKGGDVSLFSRSGEELEYLRAKGISCELVAGITALSGTTASLGIPLTHREFASELLVMSGHKKNGKNQSGFIGLNCEDKTIVVYMGLSCLKEISDTLINSGNDRQMPVAIIENATRVNERTILGNLETIPFLAQEHEISSPALILIGRVLTLIKHNSSPSKLVMNYV